MDNSLKIDTLIGTDYGPNQITYQSRPPEKGQLHFPQFPEMKKTDTFNSFHEFMDLERVKLFTNDPEFKRLIQIQNDLTGEIRIFADLADGLSFVANPVKEVESIPLFILYKNRTIMDRSQKKIGPFSTSEEVLVGIRKFLEENNE